MVFRKQTNIEKSDFAGEMYLTIIVQWAKKIVI